MFSQLLKLFPRTEFQALGKRTHAERHARGFTCWGQFVGMLFCQLGRAHSLREICAGLRSSEGKLKHLGITAPSRSPPGLRERASAVAALPSGVRGAAPALPALAKGRVPPRGAFGPVGKLPSLSSRISRIRDLINASRS
jgi:hypothetical protein